MSKNAFVNADGLLFTKSRMQRRVEISGCVRRRRAAGMLTDAVPGAAVLVEYGAGPVAA